MIDVATGDLRICGLADRIVTVEALAAALDRAGLGMGDAHPGWGGTDVEPGDQVVVVVAERR